jgi:inorganic triphosphatase YgiF
LAAVPTETEIKLVFEPGSRGNIERHPIFSEALRAKPARRELTTYFDTDDLLLHRHGYSLRIRRSDGQIVQTLKQAAEKSAIVLRRNEWEWQLKTGRPLLRPVRELLAKAGLDGALRDPKARIVTEILRRSFEIVHDGCEIEVAIDEGVVRAHGREEAIHEVELEVRQGPAGPAYRLALQLLEHDPFRLGAESKADRGYRLLTGCGTPPKKSRDAPLPRDAALDQAFAWTVGAPLQGFVDNIPAALAGIPEGIHQARVALRQVRSMLVFYAPYLELSARERFNNAIREMGEVLGIARDWDVFLDETVCDATRAGVPADWIAALSELAEARRKAAHAAVRLRLESKAPAELVLGLEAWIGESAWASDPPHHPQTPVRKILPELLDRLADKVERRGRNIGRISARALHPLRKSVKKLRYSAESASGLYGGKSVKRYVKACKNLQTILGAINDARVTTRLLAEIVPEDSAALGAAAGALQRWNANRQKGVRRDLEKAWGKLKSAGPFWK